MESRILDFLRSTLLTANSCVQLENMELQNLMTFFNGNEAIIISYGEKELLEIPTGRLTS